MNLPPCLRILYHTFPHAVCPCGLSSRPAAKRGVKLAWAIDRAGGLMLYCANFKGGQGDGGECKQSRGSAPEGTAEVPAGEDRRRAAGRETRRTSGACSRHWRPCAASRPPCAGGASPIPSASRPRLFANAAKDAGATLAGEILKQDDTNEAGRTDGKIAAWVETPKA